eukprot:TRINITY_DN14702_c0_g1_i1.p1 TRINITY_DN14702_c0_g1~~TRINITY_DN14702_c0_g1_i1.p1  ORF type:complete len:87 (-),score=11.89 TRINITY_DN14702_c0_g1_i1:145-405(-)
MIRRLKSQISNLDDEIKATDRMIVELGNEINSYDAQINEVNAQIHILQVKMDSHSQNSPPSLEDMSDIRRLADVKIIRETVGSKGT